MGSHFLSLIGPESPCKPALHSPPGCHQNPSHPQAIPSALHVTPVELIGLGFILAIPISQKHAFAEWI
jgi:hypothetical protein